MKKTFAEKGFFFCLFGIANLLVIPITQLVGMHDAPFLVAPMLCMLAGFTIGAVAADCWMRG